MSAPLTEKECTMNCGPSLLNPSTPRTQDCEDCITVLSAAGIAEQNRTRFENTMRHLYNWDNFAMLDDDVYALPSLQDRWHLWNIAREK